MFNKFFKFGVGLLLVFGISFVVLANSKEEVTDVWKNYFQSIESAKIHTQTAQQMWEGKNIDKVWSDELIVEGKKFRYESHLPKSAEGYSTIVRSYNGKQYQLLEGYREPNLYQSDELGGLYPYPTSVFPSMDLFSFAFARGDVQSLETLQRPETWESVRDRITRMEPATWREHSGFWINLNGATEGERYEVFIEKSTYFPLYVKHVLQNNALADYVEIITVKRKALQADGKMISFPLRIEWSGYQDGKVSSRGFFEVNEDKLVLNQPVKDEVFTIPVTQAAYLIDKKGTTKIRAVDDEMAPVDEEM